MFMFMFYIFFDRILIFIEIDAMFATNKICYYLKASNLVFVVVKKGRGQKVNTRYDTDIFVLIIGIVSTQKQQYCIGVSTDFLSVYRYRIVSEYRGTSIFSESLF